MVGSYINNITIISENVEKIEKQKERKASKVHNF